MRRPLLIGLGALALLTAVFVGMSVFVGLRPPSDDGGVQDPVTVAAVPVPVAPQIANALAAEVHPPVLVREGVAPPKDEVATPRVAPGAAKEGAALASEGTLVITSEPAGARVSVNGVGWGATPITVRHQSFGAKTVRLTYDGYHAQERSVRLRPDQASVRVQVVLRPRPTP